MNSKDVIPIQTRYPHTRDLAPRAPRSEPHGPSIAAGKYTDLAKRGGYDVTWLPPIDAGFSRIFVGVSRRGRNAMAVMRIVGSDGENMRGDIPALMGRGVVALMVRRLGEALAELGANERDEVPRPDTTPSKEGE